MTALLPNLRPGEAPDILKGVPQAIATVAGSNTTSDSSYLLALIKIAETLGNRKAGDPLVATFTKSLAGQLGLPNEPLQSAALVRAAVPLLETQGERMSTLVSAIAATILVPEGRSGPLDPTRRSVAYAENALQHALRESYGAAPKNPEAALELLHADWSAEPAPNARPNPYRRAAQARLLAVLAPSLTPEAATLATADLSRDAAEAHYLAREAIARALAELARKLPDAERRGGAGSRQDRRLPGPAPPRKRPPGRPQSRRCFRPEPHAATTEIVEALKYPTATEAPSEILLAALAKPSAGGVHGYHGQEAARPSCAGLAPETPAEGPQFTDPPHTTRGLQSAAAGPEPR